MEETRIELNGQALLSVNPEQANDDFSSVLPSVDLQQDS